MDLREEDDSTELDSELPKSELLSTGLDEDTELDTDDEELPRLDANFVDFMNYGSQQIFETAKLRIWNHHQVGTKVRSEGQETTQALRIIQLFQQTPGLLVTLAKGAVTYVLPKVRPFACIFHYVLACAKCNGKRAKIDTYGPLCRYGYTRCQIRRHNRREDCWLIAHGRVYDATKFIDLHPAGPTPILSRAGGDASADYDFHSPYSQRTFWKPLCIGKLVRCPLRDEESSSFSVQSCTIQ